MDINEKINNRSYNARVEKYKGSKGLAFSVGAQGAVREDVIENGGTNQKAFHLTKSLKSSLKEKYINTPCHSRWYQK